MLRELVAVKLVPADDPAAKELREHYQVPGYPTLLFADAEGNEIDRLGEFMPPERFLSEVQRIKAGDTFSARLARFDQDPTSFELLEQVADGFFARGNLAGIYEQVDAFQAATELDPDPSMPLLIETMTLEHGLLYYRAGRAFRKGWQEPPDVSGARSTPALVSFLAGSPAELPEEEQIYGLRTARQEDAANLLSMMTAQPAGAKASFEAAGFAFENGLYDRAAELYAAWYEVAGEDAGVDELNLVAWRLYLARRAPELAERAARAAYAIETSPDIADTLARVLYLNGATEEAITIQSQAAAAAPEDDAASYLEVVEQMKEGEQLSDSPRFDRYPEG